MLVPSEALQHLKCNICNKYLSYFPISIAQDTNFSICGRCSEILTTSECIRDTKYEALAQYLQFPCIYSSAGCVDHLTPTDIPEHERVCPYRIVSCPSECVWNGPVNELLSHVEDTHQASILRDGEFEMDCSSSYEVFNFLIHQDELFTLRRTCNPTENVLKYSLFCYRILEHVTRYFYEVTVYNGTRNLSIKHSLKSADNFLPENVTKISVDEVKKKLNDPSIMIGSVTILTPEDTKQKQLQEKKPHPELNLEMLRELECPFCLEYIIPPIYQCVTGHSICSTCKGKRPQCILCEKDIGETQNFTLEKMAFLITYPCKYADSGCDYVAKAGKMKQHQKYCEFAPHYCPLQNDVNCDWSGQSKATYAHVLERHHDHLLEIDQIYTFLNDGYLNATDNLCFIKKFSDVLFKFRYRYAQDKFCWAMQLIGPSEAARNYKFEIDVLDNNNSNQKLFLRSTCTGVKSRDETFCDAGEYVFVHLDQIRSFITDQLNYTVRVTKDD